MCTNKLNVTSVFSVLVVMVLLFFAPYGHAKSANTSGTSRMEPLPVYQKGTTFVYSDGSWETVVANSPDRVTWRDHRGYVSSGSADFTRRRTEWQTKTRQGYRQFEPRKDLWIKHKTSLWPLQIGNEASYSETGVWQRHGEPENTYRANWSCEVAGNEKIPVMAGEFDTWKIVCKRYAGKKLSAKSRLREIKIWHYAPEVGHFVLATRQYYTGKPSQRIELLAVLPPLNGLSAAAKRQLQSDFQKALEFKKSGESLKWSLPGSALYGEIKPTGTFRLDNGKYARRYIQKINLQQKQQTFYGMAIRDTKGKWTVPRR